MAGQTPYSNLGRYLQDLKKKRENKSKTLQGKKLGKAPAIAKMEYSAENQPARGYMRGRRDDRETVYRQNHDPYAYGRQVGDRMVKGLKESVDTGIVGRDYAAERGENESKRKRIKKYNVQGL